MVIIKVSLTRIRSARDNEAFDLKRPRGTRGKREREEVSRCRARARKRRRTKRRRRARSVRGSLLPARAMRVRAYICVRMRIGGNAYARSNEKRKCVHRTEKKLYSRGGRLACASTPLPPYSIGRLIFYSGRSRICICSGVPFPSTTLLFLSVPLLLSGRVHLSGT